jgi:urea transport system ATP-binding protein
MSLMAVAALNQSYGGSHTLWDVDLDIPAGSRMCLMGRNGMGKTTLLKCIMGLLPVASGELSFGGRDLRRLPAEGRARLGIGYVPQGREIFPQLTVEENLRVGLGVRRGGGKTVPPKIFELFPVLAKMLKRRGGDLSGGQQQQLAIARALATGPKLLILDEPTEGIQPSIIKDIGRVIRRLAQHGMGGGGPMAVVLVEQFYDFAEELADQYLVMERGEVVLRGRGPDMRADGVRQRMAI